MLYWSSLLQRPPGGAFVPTPGVRLKRLSHESCGHSAVASPAAAELLEPRRRRGSGSWSAGAPALRPRRPTPRCRRTQAELRSCEMLAALGRSRPRSQREREEREERRERERWRRHDIRAQGCGAPSCSRRSMACNRGASMARASDTEPPPDGGTTPLGRNGGDQQTAKAVYKSNRGCNHVPRRRQ